MKHISEILIPQAQAQAITNPLAKAGIENVSDLISFLIEAALLLVGLAAIIALVVAGYRFITAGANEAQVKAAKQQIQWALLGLVLVLLSFTIIRLILNTLTNS